MFAAAWNPTPVTCAYASQWPPALVVIARSLAVALERARDFTRKLRERLDAIVDRERIAASREAQLEKDRAELRAQRAVHEEAVRELEQSRSQLQVEQAIADRNATEAAAALRSARQEAAAAKAASHDQFVWTAAMEDLEDLAEDVMITPAGKLDLSLGVAETFHPEALSFLRDKRAPEWVRSLVVQRQQLAKALRQADENANKTASLAEQLAEIVAKAGPVLTPEQQSVKNGAARALRQFQAEGRGF